MQPESPNRDRSSRRALLRAGIGCAGLPAVAMARASIRGDVAGPRTLILLHLVGGNDGLNTIIPYADPLYHELRPRLSAAARDAFPIDTRTSLHGSLSSLLPLYRSGHLAVVQGVGYGDPDYSHVGSQRIWKTGSRDPGCSRLWWDGVLKGSGEPSARAITLRRTEGGLSRTLGAAVRAIASQRPPRLVFASLEGFDTHEDQLLVHARVLRELGDGLSAFQSELDARGLADRVVLMAWSEFGRRPAENAGGGTDHGSAGPVFTLGKLVQGGLKGVMPSLANTDFGNLVPTVDFCDVYAAMAEQWLGWTCDASTRSAYDLELIAGGRGALAI